MFDVRITNDHSGAQVGAIMDVLRQPRLWIPTESDYPDHDLWLQKVESQLVTGKKRAMAAYCAGRAIGSVIYQRHEEQPNILEVRNISILPENGGRYIGSFLLRNSEIEGAANDFPGIDQVMVDTKVSNTDMIQFLQSHGYELQEITDLYGTESGLDAVFIKPV